ncbi:hypothetical protein V8G54_033557 [Vigna mungo]|uniref:Putative plant transposon protein domain-containing protein n=1 Tax=Vigna mungo TaxID=3915 RepID=A0AAQ3MQ15_VIGMU
MWSAFSFTNLSPNTHTSDINLERSYPIYGIVTGMEIDIGAHISQEIAYTADTASVKLGFRALITTLCKEKGVLSNAIVLLPLQSTIDQKFIRKNCINITELLNPQEPPHVLRNVGPSHPPCGSPLTFEATFQATMSTLFAQRGQVSIIDNIYQLSLGISDFPEDTIMTTMQFEEHVPWPEGRPESRWGEVLMFIMDMKSRRTRMQIGDHGHHNLDF